ncbi:hypothetical protein TB2_040654 [Malus domestica]
MDSWRYICYQQELETVVKVKDNEVLRALKASKTTRGEGIMQNGGLCNTNSVSVNSSPEVQTKHPYASIRNLDRTENLENDLLCYRKTENSNFTDHVDLSCTKMVQAPLLMIKSDAVSDTRKETPTCNDTARTPAADIADVVILDDGEQDYPCLTLERSLISHNRIPDQGMFDFLGTCLGLMEQKGADGRVVESNFCQSKIPRCRQVHKLQQQLQVKYELHVSFSAPKEEVPYLATFGDGANNKHTKDVLSVSLAMFNRSAI